MLYGMDEDDYKDEYNYPIKQEKKLNIKKVVLVIAIVLFAILIIYVSFKISYSVLNKNSSNEQIAENSENVLSQKANETVDQKDKKKKNKEGKNVYEGNHVQIALHDIEKIKTKFVPQPNDNAKQLIKDIYYSDEKQVYLTFDDGPSKNITPQILDVLKLLFLF